MKPGKSRGPSAASAASSLPKALLPDPDSLLHHIDRAVVSTEYARASQFLANAPLNPHISSPSRYPADHENSRKALLPVSMVEDFLHRLTMGREGRESPRHENVVTSIPGKLRHQPPDRCRSETRSDAKSSLMPTSSLNSIKTDRKLEVVDFLPHRFRPQPQHHLPAVTACEASSFSTDSGGFALPSKFAIVQSNSKVSNPLSLPLPSNGNKKESGLTGVEIGRSKTETVPLLFANSTESRPIVSTVKELEGFAVNQAGSQLDSSRQYDAAAADQAFRAGSAAMEEGDMVQAIAFLRLASIKCPRNRPSALLKIEKLITAATHELEMQEASRNTAMNYDHLEELSKAEASAAEGLGFQMPMKVLAVGDMLRADEAYRAGVAALEKGEPSQALEHLRMAASACPEDRQTAVGKIRTLIQQANFEIRMR